MPNYGLNINVGSGRDEPLNGKDIKFKGSIRAEAPGLSLEKFDGNIEMDGGNTAEVTLGIDHFMMNGTILKNTPWVLVFCIFTGNDTRMMMNS